ncbi:MAG: hypothetical protein RLZZ206_217 [Cyanobacteriota bacterium]|jgi:hypothetical protein
MHQSRHLKYSSIATHPLRPGDGERYPYEMSEALPVLHLEVSHNVSALIYDRRSNGRKYSVAYSYCQGGVPNASKVSRGSEQP